MQSLNTLKLHILNHIKGEQKIIWKKICKILITRLVFHIQQTHPDDSFLYRNQINQDTNRIIALAVQQVISSIESNREHSRTKQHQSLLNQTIKNKRSKPIHIIQSKVIHCFVNQKGSIKSKILEKGQIQQDSVNQSQLNKNTKFKSIEQQIKAYERTFQAMLIEHTKQRDTIDVLSNKNLISKVSIVLSKQKNRTLVQLLNQQATIYLQNQNRLESQLNENQLKMRYLSQQKLVLENQITKFKQLIKSMEDFYRNLAKQLRDQIEKLSDKHTKLIASQKNQYLKWNQQSQKKSSQINILVNKVAKLQDKLLQQEQKQGKGEQSNQDDRFFLLSQLNECKRANRMLIDQNKRTNDKIQQMSSWMRSLQCLNVKLQRQNKCLNQSNIQITIRNRQLIKVANRFERKQTTIPEEHFKMNQDCLGCEQKLLKITYLSRLIDQVEIASKNSNFGQRHRDKQIHLDQSLLKQFQIESLSRINQSYIESFNKQTITMSSECNQ